MYRRGHHPPTGPGGCGALMLAAPLLGHQSIAAGRFSDVAGAVGTKEKRVQGQSRLQLSNIIYNDNMAMLGR